jgi:SEC-C motif-containing protein
MKRAITRSSAAQAIGPDACPCGRAATYAACCGRYHHGPLAMLAPDPESLMRSRYSAFVKDERAYLLATWHPTERPSLIEPPEAGFCGAQQVGWARAQAGRTQ